MLLNYYTMKKLYAPSVQFIVLSSSKVLISSQVVGWNPIVPGKEFSEIAILAVSPQSQDFLSPALLLGARDANFYVDRRIRMLGACPNNGKTGFEAQYIVPIDAT